MDKSSLQRQEFKAHFKVFLNLDATVYTFQNHQGDIYIYIENYIFFKNRSAHSNKKIPAMAFSKSQFELFTENQHFL